MINYALAKEKELSSTTIIDLEKQYGIIRALYNVKLKDIPQWFSSIDNYNQLITETEFTIQKLWKFQPDPNYHRMWFEDPKCSCPNMDNKDRLGTPYKIINEECKLHGTT